MKIGVLLAGCGHLDGAEIREAVLTYLALSRYSNVEVISMAPNRTQHHTINHITMQEQNSDRNILEESARIARGDIQDLAKIDPSELDALIIPGGFGVAKNFSNFAFKGSESEIENDIKTFVSQIIKNKKPLALICIAPAVINLIEPSTVTIGSDKTTATAIASLGGKHIDAKANEIIIDEQKKIVSTPAYMLDAPLCEISEGIEKCINKVIELTK
jgi:enhancing lycopene biosynthesis protein 2